LIIGLLNKQISIATAQGLILV